MKQIQFKIGSNFIEKMSSTGRQIIVCMTGFTQNPKLQQYQKQINSLGCKFIEQLAQGTDILLVDNTSTEKYKIAKLKKNITQCLSIKWLQESIKAGKPLQIREQFKLPKIFYGIKVGLYGFKSHETKSIEAILSKNGGKVQIITNSLDPDIHLIITKKQQLRRLGSTSQIQLPLVGLDWIEQSLTAGVCKYPLDYAMNYSSLCKNQFTNYISRLKKKLTSFAQGCFLDSRNQFLGEKSEKLPKYKNPVMVSEQCIVYIDPNSIDANIRKLLKKIICVNGGMFINTLNPCLTHILVGQITEEEYKSMLHYGNLIHVLRVQWLIDSVLFSQRLDEVDYKIRCFKRKPDENYSVSSMSVVKNKKENSDQNSILKAIKSERKSISDVRILEAKSLNMKKTKSRCEPTKSTIFKNKYFLLDPVQKKDLEMQGIVTKIRQNCGTIYDKPIKNHLNYVVMSDSDKNLSILEKLASSGKQLSPVSYRWVNTCISKGEFLDPVQSQYFIFKPFKFKTPCPQMMLMKIQIIGVDEISRLRYIEVLNALGANKVCPNKVDITHCICGEAYKEDPKYDEIKKQNKSLKFIDLEWLKKSMSEGIRQLQEYELK